jgi:hypothetical protein
MTKLEEVARAIYLANPDVGDNVIPWEKAPQDHAWCFSAARAAIEALPLADAARWIETLAEPNRWGPVTEEKRQAAVAFSKTLWAILSEGDGAKP